MEEESTPAEAASGDDQKKEAEEVKEEEEAEVKEESKETSTGEAKINPLLVHVSFVNFSKYISEVFIWSISALLTFL
jgi:hypothetical protein